MSSALVQGRLGVANRPEELVPGDPEEVWRCADRVDGLCDRLAGLAWDIERAAADSGCWTGRGAEVFWGSLEEIGEGVRSALAALAPVADAFRQYARVLGEAQSEARALMSRWDAAEQAASAARTADPLRAARTHTSPGYGTGLSWDQVRAVEDLRVLRADVATVARGLAGVLADSVEDTPRATGVWNEVGYHASQFGHGIVDAVAGAADLLWDYGLRWTFDPVGGTVARWGLISSLVQAAFDDPLQFGKDLIDWDTWVSNPARAAGRLAPDAALAIGTGGLAAGASRGSRAARVAAVASPDVSSTRALHQAISGFWAGRRTPGVLGEFDPASVFPHAGTTPLLAGRAERWLELNTRWGAQGRPGLSALAHGNLFNQLRAGVYAYDEVHLRLPDGRLTRLDSWTPDSEVVSRKATQLSQVGERTAMGYLTEFKDKYWPDDERIVVADTVGSRQMFADRPRLIGAPLSGRPVLEVPVQHAEVPPAIREYAGAEGIVIRDVTGHVYNQDELDSLRAGDLP